jgi:hypothetical protein
MTMLCVLAVLALGWVVYGQSESRHRQQVAINREHKAIILRDHESLLHLQGRVDFLDNDLRKVCKEARIACPAIFPLPTPTPVVIPGSRTAPASTHKPETTPSPQVRPSPTATPSAVPTPTPASLPLPTPTPGLCLGSICIPFL